MAGSIATAYVQVVPSMQGVKGSLTKEFGGQGTSSGSLFGSNLVKAAMGIFSTAKLGEALWKTLNVGAELQQNLGGTEAVFADFASSITTAAEQAYNQMGLSASDYMATANKMGSLFQGSGLEQQRAMDLTAKAMQRAADVASVMGIDTTMAMESIAGAAKGNFTMMDNLGVAMNATTLEAYALEKGVNFKWNTASNAEKAELAMEMFFDRTAQYAGNFEREASETFSGAFEAMKASAQNVLGNLALGKDIAPSLQALAKTTGTFIKWNLIPMVLNIFRGLPGGIRTLLTAMLPNDILGIVTTFASNFSAFMALQLPMMITSGQMQLQGLLSGFQSGFPGFMSTVTGLLSQVLTAIITALPLLLSGGVSMLTAIVSGLLSALPALITSAGTLMTTLLSAVMETAPQLLSSGVQLIASLAQGLISSVPSIINSAVTLLANLLSTFASYLPDLLAQGVSMIGQLVAGIISMIPDVISGAADIVSNIWNTIFDTDWISLGSDIVEGIVNGLLNAAGSLFSALKELASDALQAAKDALAINSPSRIFRDGVGRWIPAGIAVGIRNASGLVDDAITDLAAGTPAEFTAALQVNPSRSGAGSALAAPNGKVVNFVQNVYAQAQTAAELAQETRYQAEMKVLFGV